MSSAETPTDSPRRDRLVVALLVLAAVVPFIRTLGFGYVLDDTFAIRGNASLAGWGSMLRVWTEQFGGADGPFHGLYRPLTMSVFAVLWNAGGHWPIWFHAAAIAMHAVATVLVWRLLARATDRWPAVLGALWFAVHPVHVEAVANVANSSEVLVAIWTCALALFVLRVRDSGREATLADAAIAGTLYLAAMLSKESGAMAAPLAAVCALGWRSGETRPALPAGWQRVVVGWIAAVGVVAIMRAQVLGGPVTGKSIAAEGIAQLSGFDRMAAMLSLSPKIAALLVWPAALNPHYGPSSFPGSRALVALFTVAALAAVSFFVWRSFWAGRPRALAGVVWILLAFLPASNLFVATGQILAERTLYVPSIGVVMLVALLLDRVAEVERLGRPGRGWCPAIITAVALVIALHSARTALWTRHWRNHDSLFAQMMRADPRGYVGFWLAGIEASRAGRPEQGLDLLGRAYANYRFDRGLVLDYGEALTVMGQPDNAAVVYREALRRTPADSALTARLAALRAP